MNSENDLMPPNATVMERNLALSMARMSAIPLMVRKTWNPDTCPSALLPWLAWAFSVDEWDDTWSEQAKRNVIKNARYVHQKKGTLSAIKRAVDPLGYIIETVECWQDNPPGPPHSFRIVVGVTETALTESVYNQIVRLIETYKNERSYLSAMTVMAETRGDIYIGSAIMSGVDTTIYPYMGGELENAGAVFMATMEHSIDSVTLYPN